MTDFRTFESEYSDLAYDVALATHQNFALRLKDWLNFLDETPESAAIISRLESRVDFEQWFEEAAGTRRGMVGSGRLNWAEDREERLGQYLGLFRYLASEEDAFSGFAVAFAWAGPNLNDNVAKITADFFEPFRKELKRKLSREWDTALSGASSDNDRVVRLDSADPNVSELRAKLIELEAAMRESTNNAFKADPDYARNLVELTAANQVLAADEVRVSVVDRLLVPVLKWLGEKGAEAAVQVAVTAALVLIAALFKLKILGVG